MASIEALVGLPQRVERNPSNKQAVTLAAAQERAGGGKPLHREQVERVTQPRDGVGAEGGEASCVLGMLASPNLNCAVRADTTVECWGSNQAGLLGSGAEVSWSCHRRRRRDRRGGTGGSFVAVADSRLCDRSGAISARG